MSNGEAQTDSTPQHRERPPDAAASQNRPRAQGRLEVVDALRPLALFGVLVINWHSMAGLEFLDRASFEEVQGTVGQVVDTLLMILLDKVSLSAFSFMFGLSFALQLDRSRESGTGFIILQLRRLLVLGLLGVINFMFFYWGDILITYMVFGALLLPLVRLPQPALLTLAAALLLGTPVLLAAMGGTPGVDVQTAADRAALEAFGSPSYWDTVRHGIERYLFLAGGTSAYGNWNFANIFGLFVLGLWTGRAGIPADIDGHRRMLRRVAAIGLPLGVLACTAAELMPQDQPLALGLLFGRPVLAVSALAGAALLLSRPGAGRLTSFLAPGGRMALTNYLAYGLLGQIVFYGWAFGLIGTVGSHEVLLYSTITFILLLVASQAWLRPFRQGPAEWLWRTLTRLQVQPIRR